MKKAKAKVDTTFDCPFCNHKQTVECKMNYETNLGNIKCRVCAATFQCDIHHLSDPIDVYSEWIDQTEELNKQQAAQALDTGLGAEGEAAYEEVDEDYAGDD